MQRFSLADFISDIEKSTDPEFIRQAVFKDITENPYFLHAYYAATKNPHTDTKTLDAMLSKVFVVPAEYRPDGLPLLTGSQYAVIDGVFDHPNTSRHTICALACSPYFSIAQRALVRI